jgi:hypothetical protein
VDGLRNENTLLEFTGLLELLMDALPLKALADLRVEEAPGDEGSDDKHEQR